MPIDLSRYPKNWRAIARQVKDAAGWRCEQCGHVHEPAAGYSLTVHHIDGDPRNSCSWNLVALCQRCHLSLHQRQLVGQYWFDFAKPAWLRRREREAGQSAALVQYREHPADAVGFRFAGSLVDEPSLVTPEVLEHIASGDLPVSGIADARCTTLTELLQTFSADRQ